MRRTKSSLNLKFRNRARFCATCEPRICNHLSHLGLEIIHELDEVAVVVLIEMLCFEIRELMLCFLIVDGDVSFPHELLCEEIPEGDVLRPCVGVEGERPQVTQRILLKRCQAGCAAVCLSTWW